MSILERRRKGTAGRRKKPSTNRTEFSAETFEAIADDLQAGAIPLKRVTITDEGHNGLRVIIRDTGRVSFHVSYQIEDSRPYLKIGDHPDMTVKDARALAKTITELADQGIDPQEGLHERLIRELKEKGSKWRP